MSDLRPYAQLVRLPNLPTAWADILLAALAVGALPGRWPALVLLLLASSCLYCAGMVWNDYFDLEQDRRERPERPIASGRVSLRRAAALGTGLLAGGVVLAWLAGRVLVWRGEATSGLRPALLALCLVAAILLYDSWLKRTWAGPLGMGMCRFLNVLLGVSLAGSLVWPLGAHLGLVVGLYIVGVTWFARTEARVSSQTALLGAAGVILAALVLALPLGVQRPPGSNAWMFPYLLVALGFVLGLPIQQAITAARPGGGQALPVLPDRAGRGAGHRRGGCGGADDPGTSGAVVVSESAALVVCDLIERPGILSGSGSRLDEVKNERGSEVSGSTRAVGGPDLTPVNSDDWSNRRQASSLASRHSTPSVGVRGASLLGGPAPECYQFFVGNLLVTGVLVAEADEPLLGRRPLPLAVALLVQPVGVDEAGHGIVLIFGQGLEEAVPQVHGNFSLTTAVAIVNAGWAPTSIGAFPTSSSIAQSMTHWPGSVAAREKWLVTDQHAGDSFDLRKDE
jgi:4-hydroxybenzoate polyprenyltransferase